MTGTLDARLPLVARLTAAIGRELAERDPAQPVPWPTLPDVRAMVLHVGEVHRWVAAVLASRGPVEVLPPDPGEQPLGEWYAEGRAALLDALHATPPDAPCWVLGGPDRTAGFWRRRMVVENAKHLIDLRAAGGAGWRPAPELRAVEYADAVDELLTVFLPRSRRLLAPLPCGVELRATDVGRRWVVGADWSTDGAVGETRVHASAADLALVLWERADPLADDGRFRIEGDRGVVAALRSAPVHPW